jgi:hypothetical protein
MPKSKINLDIFISEFSNKIYSLKEYEFDKNNIYSKKHHDLFNQLLNILLKKKKFGLYQNLWTELYFHSIYFYSTINKIGNIPIKIVTKHNNILPFYMDQNLQKIKTTIVHFDTHPDMNEVKNSANLPHIYKKYLETKNDSYKKEAQKIVWDIGSAISGVLFTTGIQNYIWCMPSWIPDKNINTTYFLKKNKNEIVAYTNDELLIDDELCDINYTSKHNDVEKECIYSKIQTGKPSKNIVKNIIKNINNNKYILDIDLDYFICNGQKLNIKSYMKEPYDLESFYRTKKIIVNQDNPRDSSENTTELERYEKQLAIEVRYINKRIKYFLNIISSLKKKGFIPSHISICDSTNIEFFKCHNCNSISNGYVPTNLALYVHTKVFNGLIKIFHEN